MYLKGFLFVIFLLSTKCLIAAAPTGINPTQTMPEEKSHFSFSPQVEFLYWRLQEGGLDFAYNQAVAPVDENYGVSGQIISGEYDWHPGFRVAFSYDWSDSQWGLIAQYGSFNSHQSKELFPHDGVLLGTFPQLTTTTMVRATSYVSFRSHMADFLLTKRFDFNKYFSFTLLNGVTGVWFEHNWDVNYFGDVGGNQCIIRPKWHFKGGGPKIGGGIDWFFGKGFSMIGKTSVGALMGNYDNRFFVSTLDLADESIRIVRANTHYDDFRVVTNVQLALGPAWEYFGKSCGVKMMITYELNSWFNLVEFHRQQFSSPTTFSGNSRHTAPTFEAQGMTASFYLYF